MVKIFSHSVGCYFVLLTVFLQKWLSSKMSHLLIFNLCVCAIGFGMLKPVAMCSRLFLIFFSVRFSVSELQSRALICLNFSFVQGDSYWSICIFVHADIQLCQWQLLKMLSLFSKNQLFVLLIHCIVLFASNLLIQAQDWLFPVVYSSSVCWFILF